AKTIQNSAASGSEEPQTDPVLVSEHRIAIRFQKLQLVHPAGDGGQQYCLTAREYCGAPGELLLSMRVAPHCRSCYVACSGGADGAPPIKERWLRPSRTLATGNREIVSTAQAAGLWKPRSSPANSEWRVHRMSIAPPVSRAKPAHM